MHLKKFMVFYSLPKPETHFRHVQGHQRASALSSSTNLFQSTFITVYEVEHQQTVNIKLGKHPIWVSEVIKEFYYFFLERKLADTKRQKVKLPCIPEASQSTLQNPIGKRYKDFQRIDPNTPQLKHRKKSKSSKRITIELFFQISVHTDMRSTKKKFSNKNPKINHSWSKYFWNPIANVSVKLQYEKTSIQNLKHNVKFFIPITEAFIPINTMKWKRSCNQLSSFLSEPNLSTRSKTSLHLKKSKFLSNHRSHKHNSGTRRATNKQMN